jgi:hypothetical protein
MDDTPRHDLVGKVADWLKREPKANMQQAKRLYGLSTEEVLAISQRLAASPVALRR